MPTLYKSATRGARHPLSFSNLSTCARSTAFGRSLGYIMGRGRRCSRREESDDDQS